MSSSFHDGEPKSSRAEPSSSNSRNSIADEENAPLLSGPSTDRAPKRRRHSTRTLDSAFDINPDNFRRRSPNRQYEYHSSDESFFFDYIMEKVRSTRLVHLLDKLAVESEPGLTNAQLMLNNNDLKPGKNNVPSAHRQR